MFKPFQQILKTLLVTFLLSGITIAEPSIYLYLLKFDNIPNDESIDWLRQGLVDVLGEKLSDHPQVLLKGSMDLEEVMKNRLLLRNQPKGIKNILLLGKFDRSIDEIKVNIQMIDIATWEELDSRKLIGSLSKIPVLSEQLVGVVSAMLLPYIPERTKAEKAYPEFVTPPSKKPDTKMANHSKRLTESIDIGIDRLEESMDLVIGARGEHPEKDPAITGEWVLDLNVDHEEEEKPEYDANTSMLVQALDNLTKTPYKVYLSEPKFEYNEDNTEKMDVVFPVTYSLKENLIKDMLTSIPYSALRQDGTLTIFYYNKDKFNFPTDFMNRIKYGSYRAIPVIQFFDEDGDLVVLIADTPDVYWHSKSSDRLQFIPTHHFSPLIDFTIGGWSLQVTMETVEIPVNYTFSMDLDLIQQLDRVSLKFVPENELQSFLDNTL